MPWVKSISMFSDEEVSVQEQATGLLYSSVRMTVRFPLSVREELVLGVSSSR